MDANDYLIEIYLKDENWSVCMREPPMRQSSRGSRQKCDTYCGGSFDVSNTGKAKIFGRDVTERKFPYYACIRRLRVSA